MEKTTASVAQQIAEAAVAFERKRTGHVPESVTVVLGDDTLVITLHGALSQAERALAQTPDGAREVQEFHRHASANGKLSCPSASALKTERVSHSLATLQILGLTPQLRIGESPE